MNPIDTFIHEGNAFVKPKLPYTPGFDLAGIVKELGPNVTKFQVCRVLDIASNMSDIIVNQKEK